MNNIFKFSIVTSFLGLWIATHIPEKFELILGFILIFSFGMIHGSNDLLIINKILEKSKYYSKFNILVAYLMIVSLAILIFYMAPILALSMFVIFSAYHFGEQHWEKSFIKSNNSLKSIFYFCYGMLILQLLFTFNDIGVKFIVKEITGYQIANLNSFETKSIWQVKDAFMSGPFINYWIEDKVNNRYLIVEGFVFAPSLGKRDYIFELEAIIRSIIIKQ